VIGALDDKIELNRRMNATLEAMARALFQSWFVDFDPVRAKLDGRQPFGLDSDTAALFPANFEESALGPIPQGWEAGRLDDVLTLQRGFDLPTPDRTHGKYPVMAASGPNGCHDKFMVRGPGVTTGRSGVLGRVFFIHGDFWPLNTSLWVKEFKRVSTAYSFHLLRGLDFEMFNAGSAVPTLNRNHVHNLPVVIPPKPIIEAFDSLVMPLMKRQKANEDQSHILATLRDTMLPKLLSGELQINE
jgi:type I restriction enzyme, S subunit